MKSKTLADIIRSEAEECELTAANHIYGHVTRTAFSAVALMLRSLHEKIRTCQESEK